MAGDGWRYWPDSHGTRSTLGRTRASRARSTRCSGRPQACPQLSWADLIQLASATAIEASVGEDPRRMGESTGFPASRCRRRLGCPMPSSPWRPEPDDPAAHLRYVFYKYGMDDRDIVALSGAHTLGRAFKDCHAVDDGFDGDRVHKEGCPFLQNSKTTGASVDEALAQVRQQLLHRHAGGRPGVRRLPDRQGAHERPRLQGYFVEFAESQSASSSNTP